MKTFKKIVKWGLFVLSISIALGSFTLHLWNYEIKRVSNLVSNSYEAGYAKGTENLINDIRIDTAFGGKYIINLEDGQIILIRLNNNK